MITVLPISMLTIFAIALLGVVGWIVPVAILIVLAAAGIWMADRHDRDRARARERGPS